jgi:hypothetical protein
MGSPCSLVELIRQSASAAVGVGRQHLLQGVALLTDSSTWRSWTCRRFTSSSSILRWRMMARPMASRPIATAPMAPAPRAAAPTATAPRRAAGSWTARRVLAALMARPVPGVAEEPMRRSMASSQVTDRAEPWTVQNVNRLPEDQRGHQPADATGLEPIGQRRGRPGGPPPTWPPGRLAEGGMEWWGAGRPRAVCGHVHGPSLPEMPGFRHDDLVC